MAHMPTLEEVETAIRKLKNNKAAGVCKILLEMLKYGGQCVTNMLHRVISRVWQTGKAPADWKKSLLVTILKKGDPTSCLGMCSRSLLLGPSSFLTLRRCGVLVPKSLPVTALRITSPAPMRYDIIRLYHHDLQLPRNQFAEFAWQSLCSFVSNAPARLGREPLVGGPVWFQK